jgi:predicted SprT family Zn-dependent metalloprotease
MTKSIKITLIGTIVLVIGGITYLFLWGKLFPYSPIIIGFSAHELSHTIIYIQHGAQYDDYRSLDGLIPAVETAHELKFIKKPKIFIFRDNDSYLQRSVTKARFYAYPNGSLVISPWALQEAQEGTISLEIYVKHELSHTLLMQYMGIVEAYRYYPRWLLEGIAVYSTHQMGTSWYPSQQETYALIRQGNFMPPEYFKTKKEDLVRLDVPYRITFMYSEFACIVEYLINTQGKDQFLRYMKSLLKNRHHDTVFREIYGIDFQTFLLNFQAFVMKNTSP